ncbi:hypothetical protein [Roseicyclus sp.]|uniref:hypothetical protein n=1 Tax=Roseicyclus sp. TaxID=1914329 RepID=UPI001BD05ACC|nr:hypothetical protein [Roseicyclus sp.]
METAAEPIFPRDPCLSGKGRGALAVMAKDRGAIMPAAAHFPIAHSPFPHRVG